MTFQTAVWAVDGNQVSGAFARVMQQAATLGAQGVIGHLDCRVQATGPATSGIVITPGNVVILGAEATFQGSYFAENIGNDTTLAIAATGASARSDMIIARAEDPTWSGSPWGNPASGQIVFPRVWSNCGAGATNLSGAPATWSAIPLARIDMPPSTATVQSAYITDLRNVMNPQRIMQMQSMQGAWATQSVSTNSASTPINWPNGASWSVFVPSWATSIVISYSINETQLNIGSTGNTGVRYSTYAGLGGTVASPTIQTPSSIIQLTSTDGNNTRHTIGGGGTLAIPASMRGTTQTLRLIQVATSTGFTGTMTADGGSGVTLIYEFQQLAAAS